MVSTLVNQGPVETYKFFEDKICIGLPGGAAYIEISAHHGMNQTQATPQDKVLSIVSDNKKLVATMHISFYHFYIDFVGKIIDQLKIDPDIEIIIHNPMENRENVPGSYVFESFLDDLARKGIKYQVHNLNQYDALEINNVYLLSNSNHARDYASGVFDFFSDHIRNPGITPHRDIFLSRRHMGNRTYPYAPDWAWSNNDNRIDSHEKIESYFKSIGYEIIVPESLNTFDEQINTFYEARTIVSTTSSGLTNSLFMQPGQTMIELVTPLMIHVSDNPNPDENRGEQWRIQEELHHFYSVLALHKKHKFLMLGNKYRSSQEVIDQIEDDKFLKSFIARN